MTPQETARYAYLTTQQRARTLSAWELAELSALENKRQWSLVGAAQTAIGSGWHAVINASDTVGGAIRDVSGGVRDAGSGVGALGAGTGGGIFATFAGASLAATIGTVILAGIGGYIAIQVAQDKRVKNTIASWIGALSL